MTTTATTPPALPPVPGSWSALTWQQLCRVWEAKLRYGGNADVARAAALLAVCGLEVVEVSSFKFQVSSKAGAQGSAAPERRRGRERQARTKWQTCNLKPETGEQQFLLRDESGRLWTVTPRQLAHLAARTLPWLDYPYGDRGDEAVKDEKGRVVREAREPHVGYVNPDWRDALLLPEETLELETIVFALPQLACNNLTWEQYRSLQPLVPQLWQEDISDADRLRLQATFVAHMLVPDRRPAPAPSVATAPAPFAAPSSAPVPYAAVPQQPAADPYAAADPFRPDHDFSYDAARAEQSIAFWQRRLPAEPWLFHICFQAYQTAVQYYETVFPLLFGGAQGKSDPLRDALTGEVSTVNAVMKYAGYTSQQQVYESFLPHILDILNTMTREAKEIERMNAKIKRK